MGLGALHTVSLADARQAALKCRQALLEGKDPIEERRRQLGSQSDRPTFASCAEAYIAAHAEGWRNPKHREQWRSTLDTYVGPFFGAKPVDTIDTSLVMQALEPIWAVKTETASRVRGRIEAILDWAAVRGHRSRDNPARWRGHLESLLPSRSKVRRVKHHAALPYAELPVFMAQLSQQKGAAASALQFAILTAARTGEVIGATWAEVDLPNQLWTIPASRMKAQREHRVPLTQAAIALLGRKPDRIDVPLFTSANSQRALSNIAMLALLKRMERADITPHGFRSTFRDWVAEKTEFPNELAEMALAHTVSSKVEAAYRRGDMLGRRRMMMQNWSNYATQGN